MADPLKTLDTASQPQSPPSISKVTLTVAGIAITVFGLDELPPRASEVACLWLMHPRLATQERMSGIASSAINDWNRRIRDGRTGATTSTKGLIAVSFDQRNHGTRLVDPLANEAWRQGNPRHAQDMFSVFRECHQRIPWHTAYPTIQMFVFANLPPQRAQPKTSPCSLITSRLTYSPNPSTR